MFNLREALVIAKEEVSLDGIAQAIAYEFSKSDIEEINKEIKHTVDIKSN